MMKQQRLGHTIAITVCLDSLHLQSKKAGKDRGPRQTS